MGKRVDDLPESFPKLAGLLLALLAITLVFHLPLISTPGFYNHDELQKLDFLEQNGLLQYLKAFLKIPATKHFGVPVRPVGYAAMGIMLLPMPQYPFLVHLLDVLLHFAVVAVFFWLLQKLGASLRTAFFSALFFSLSPLVVVATGWTGAVFDRLYLLFSLLALVFLHRFVGSESKFRRLVFWLLTSLASALAILSKETAVILPFFLALFAFFCQRNLGCEANVHRWLVGLCASFLPWGVYLLLRFSAVQSSLTGSGFGSYDLNLSSILRNIFCLLCFSFFSCVTRSAKFRVCEQTHLGHIVYLSRSCDFEPFPQKGVVSNVVVLNRLFCVFVACATYCRLGHAIPLCSGFSLGRGLSFFLGRWAG
jgi:hypothetical protein